MLESEYDGQIIHIDTHVSGEFFFEDVVPHRMRYNVGAIPHLQFDGLVGRIGASSCEGSAAIYREIIDERIAETALLSPIELSVRVAFAGDQATVIGTAEQADDLSLPDLQVTLFLMEDDLDWCCDSQGESHFDNITRAIYATPIELMFGGGSIDVAHAWTIEPGWVVENLWVAAIVENVDLPREIHQSAQFRDLLRVELDQSVSSLPSGSGSVEVSGQVQNGNESADLFDISILSETSWTAEFLLEGEENWAQTATVSLAAGESRDLVVRIQTDAVVQVGATTIVAEAQSSTFVGSKEFRVFNGVPAILFVDADNNATRGIEIPFQNALGRTSPFYDQVVVTGAGRGPRAETLNGYDLVVWETGFLAANAISLSSGAALTSYLENGGHLFLNSMGFAEAPGNSTELQAVLGIGAPISNTGAEEAHGVLDDPITHGLFGLLNWADPNENQVDAIVPLGGSGESATILQNESGVSNAVRHQSASGARSVLSTIELEAFGPVLSETLATSILAWLLNGDEPSSVPELDPGLELGSDVETNDSRVSGLSVVPNPVTSIAEVFFSVASPGGSHSVSLQIHDANGRLVRNLWRGMPEAASYRLKWDGRNDRGDLIPPGVYFVVLKSDDGVHRSKLVRLAN